MSGPNWKLEDDHKEVTVTFPTDPPIALQLDVFKVENLLENLGQFRAAMKPEVEMDWQPGQTVNALSDPRWYIEPERMQGNSLLHLRDPRYGWLHYMIPRNEARKLGQYLIDQADAPDPGPKSDRPN